MLKIGEFSKPAQSRARPTANTLDAGRAIRPTPLQQPLPQPAS